MPLYAACSLPGLAARPAPCAPQPSLPVDLVSTVHGPREGQGPGLALQAERSGLPGPAMAAGHIPTAWPRAQGAFLGSFHGGGEEGSARARTFLKRGAR